MRPEDFAERVRASADPTLRLPLPPQASWEILPFEDAGLRVKPLDALVLPEQLEGVGRVHVNKWGDGGAHLHVFFLARPAGMLQLRGSNLALWEEMLPRVPEEESRAALRAVGDALLAYGGRTP